MIDQLFKTMGSLANVQGAIFKWSDDFKAFYSSGYRCPKCGERLTNKLGAVTLEFYSVTGARMPFWQAGPWRADSAACPLCHYRFKLKDSAQSTPTVTSVINVIETERREDPIGTDTTLIDNSRSSVAVTRTITATKEWSRSYSIEKETSVTAGIDFDVGFGGAGSLKATCESTLSKKYVNSENHNDIYTETISVDVPGSTSLRLLIQWKNIVQLGFLEIRAGEKVTHVPFEAVVGVTFDQQQIDGAASTLPTASPEAPGHPPGVGNV